MIAKTPKKLSKKQTWLPKVGDAFTLKGRYLRGPRSEENIANWGGKHLIINIDEACNLMTVKWVKNGVESEYKYDIGYFRAVKSKFTYTAQPSVDVINEVQTSSQHKHVSVTTSTTSLTKETEDSKQSAVSLQSDHECTEATSSVWALEGSTSMSHHQSMPIHSAIANSHLPPKKRKLASMPNVPSNEGVNTTSSSLNEQNSADVVSSKRKKKSMLHCQPDQARGENQQHLILILLFMNYSIKIIYGLPVSPGRWYHLTGFIKMIQTL